MNKPLNKYAGNIGGKVSNLMKSGDAVTVGMVFATLFILPFGVFTLVEV